MQDPFKHCAALVREADRDRYLAALFTPAEHRKALYALYAFDLEISRVRDLAREPIPGEIRLQWWREVLLGERGGEAAANPVAAALLQTLSRYKLSTSPLTELIDAHRFDVYDEPMQTRAELHSYASKTAGIIFDTAARVLGAATTLTEEAAKAQTLAHVLTLLPYHSARRQLFVPIEVLEQYGAQPDDVFAMNPTAELRAALGELRLLARRHLAHIGAASGDIAASARPVFLSLAPLRSLLLAMERADYEPFRPPQVPAWRRQWQIWRAARDLKHYFS